jgi:hypothetical protein
MLRQEWLQQGLNAMGKLVADFIVETLQNAGVKHCYGVVGDTLNLIARSLEKSEIEWVSVEDRDRLPNGPGETRCCRSDRAGGYLRLGRG